MPEWEKPNHKTFPTSAWVTSWWGKRDTIKVPGHPTLPNLQNPPLLEVFTCPAKNSFSLKIYTQFDTLPSDILLNIDEWHFILVNHKKINKFLT